MQHKTTNLIAKEDIEKSIKENNFHDASNKNDEIKKETKKWIGWNISDL